MYYEITGITREIIEKRVKFGEMLESDIKYCAFESFLDSIITTKRISLEVIQQNKLTQLNHGDIFLKDNPDSVISLSSCNIDETLKRVFSLGINCNLKTKHCKPRKQIEIEKLLNDMKDEKSKRNVTIENEDVLKCELKRSESRSYDDYNKDVL